MGAATCTSDAEYFGSKRTAWILQGIHAIPFSVLPLLRLLFITDAARKQTHDRVQKVSCPVLYAHSDQVIFNKLNDLLLVPEL